MQVKIKGRQGSGKTLLLTRIAKVLKEIGASEFTLNAETHTLHFKLPKKALPNLAKNFE